jgi:hypothetical protein
MFRLASLAAAAAIPLVAIATIPAEAKITCNKGMQLVNGSYISTPYCQDALVAHVARQHGMKVSDSAIRANPNLKRAACRLVYADIRVSEACTLEPSLRRRF